MTRQHISPLLSLSPEIKDFSTVIKSRFIEINEDKRIDIFQAAAIFYRSNDIHQKYSSLVTMFVIQQ